MNDVQKKLAKHILTTLEPGTRINIKDVDGLCAAVGIGKDESFEHFLALRGKVVHGVETGQPSYDFRWRPIPGSAEHAYFVISEPTEIARAYLEIRA